MTSSRGDVRARLTPRALVVSVGGILDRPTGNRLVDAVARGIDRGLPRVQRVEIDLQGLSAFTAAGAEALVRCRGFGRRLPGGLHYTTVDGPGREAFLTAFS